LDLPPYLFGCAGAQVIYLDHRGNGCSSGEDPQTWNLAQWGDDVRAFCGVLGVEKPIVYGPSFGGMVALAYATRHPEHPDKLILVSTEAAGTSHPERRVELFERFGGPEVGALARRRAFGFRRCCDGICGHTNIGGSPRWGLRPQNPPDAPALCKT
jgi:pimeloyl-ACP methyl ester carboxylesterase